MTPDRDQSVWRAIMRRPRPRRLVRAWRMLRGDFVVYGIRVQNGTVYWPENRRGLVESCQFIANESAAVVAPLREQGGA